MLEIKIPAQKDSKIAHLFHLEISLCSWDIGKSKSPYVAEILANIF